MKARITKAFTMEYILYIHWKHNQRVKFSLSRHYSWVQSKLIQCYELNQTGSRANMCVVSHSYKDKESGWKDDAS